MAAAVKNFGNALAESVNPFNRLVITATTDDGNPGIPYFQTEKVKEAAGQSEYGCECVFKALLQRLESKSTIVQHKSLALVRSLMLEGPQGFGTKVSMHQTRFFSLAQLSDVRRDSLEAQVKHMAQNILDACNGKPGALLRSVGDSDVNNNIAGGTSMTHGRAKSDFQEAQEREAKAFKKKREEEKRAQEVVTFDKHFETYDHTLPASRLVASAVQTTKKKLAPEELCNFHEATTKYTKPSEVMMALDACLKDIKEPVQNKYKALCLIEHMVLTVPYHDAVVYFKTNVNGIVRVSQIQAGPDAPKLQQMVQSATMLLRYLATCGVPPPHAPGEAVARPAAMPNLHVPAPAPVFTSAPAAAPTPVLGASNINPAFMVTPSFANMEVKPRARAMSGTNQTQPVSFGAELSNQQSWGAPQTAPQWGNSAPPSQQIQNTWAPQPQPQQQLQPQPQPQPQHTDPNDALRLMQLQMQQQMAMMQQQMAMLSTAQAAPTVAPPFAAAPAATAPSSRSDSVDSGFGASSTMQRPTWGSSVAAPPPLPQELQEEPRGRSASTLSDTHSSMPTSVPNNTMVTAPNGSFGASITSDLKSPAQPPAEPVALAAPAAPPTGIPQQTVTLEMLQQLQAQMAQTQAILSKQQAMYAKMQAQFVEQQRAQMIAFQQMQMQ